MSRAHPSLAERLRGRAFTPGPGDVPALLDYWRDAVARSPASKHRKTTKLVVQALARADRPVARLLLGDLWQSGPAERALRVRVLSRIAMRVDVPEFHQVLVRALADPAPPVARAALRAAGNLDESAGKTLEAPVVEHLRSGQLPEQRAAADALGKIGGPVGLAALRALASGDADLTRRRNEAIALVERRQLRSAPTTIQAATELPGAASIVLRCRSGMARFAGQQARALLGVDTNDDPLGVALTWAGPLEALHRVRIALDAALAFELPSGLDLAQRVADTLNQPALVAALRAWSAGPLRFRLSFVDGGARRAVVQTVARLLRERDSPLHNDSRETPWSVVVDGERHRLLCVPRDPGLRFPYERAVIPAASHPTLAALMAWVARPRPGEVVWDPFCGSGGELVECALLEPSVQLHGTDRSATALAAARANLQAAGLTANLVRGDSLRSQPAAAPSLIVTNPPMGRRAHSGRGVHETLRAFVGHAAALLPPGGRLVCVSPAAKVSAAAGRDAGMDVTDHGPVDLAGMRVHLQVLATRR